MCHLNSYGLRGYTISQGHFVDELFQGCVSNVHINTHKHKSWDRQKAEWGLCAMNWTCSDELKWLVCLTTQHEVSKFKMQL